MKYILLLLIMFSAIFSSPVTIQETGSSPVEISAVSMEGDIYLSIQPLLKSYNAIFFWSPESRKLITHFKGKDVILTEDNHFFTVDEKTYNMLKPPITVNGGFYMAAEPLCNLLSLVLLDSVNWSQEKNTIYIGQVQKSSETIYSAQDSIISKYELKELNNGTLYTLYTPFKISFDHTFFKPQLNINLFGGKIKASELENKKGSGLVEEIKAIQFENSAQLSIMLLSKAEVVSVKYKDNPSRIEAVFQNKKNTDQVLKEKIKEIESAVPENLANPVVKEEKTKGNISFIDCIIIDAGHGGKDPGARNRKMRAYEKNIVLSVALKLKNLLNREFPDIKIVMTREKDEFISLTDRKNIANKSGGDIYISIHNNSIGGNAKKKNEVSGYSIYFLDEALNDESRAVAALENQVIEFEKEDVKESFSDIDIILQRSQLNRYRIESEDLAITLEKSFYKGIRKLRRHGTGINQANFYVLRGPEMPSVLLELGYICNNKEARLLKSTEFQEESVRAIYNGLKKYIHKHKKVY